MTGMADTTMMGAELDERAAAEQSFAAIRRGGLVIGRANVGYSFICASPEAVERIYALKGRPRERRCVILTTRAAIEEMCHCDAALADRLEEISFVTPLAVILPVRYDSIFVRNYPSDGLGALVKDDGICVYLGGGRFFEHLGELACAEGVFAIGSSANTSNEGNAYRLEDVPLVIRQGVDLAFDHGPCQYANDRRLGGTIVNLFPGRQGVHRAGINADAIVEQLGSFLRREVD